MVVKQDQTAEYDEYMGLSEDAGTCGECDDGDRDTGRLGLKYILHKDGRAKSTIYSLKFQHNITEPRTHGTITATIQLGPQIRRDGRIYIPDDFAALPPECFDAQARCAAGKCFCDVFKNNLLANRIMKYLYDTNQITEVDGKFVRVTPGIIAATPIRSSVKNKVL